MRPRTWKLLGLAGLAGVTATGVVAARRRRAHREYDPEELRARLHARLAEVARPQAAPGEPPGGEAPPAAGPPGTGRRSP